ncbi:MULTISPECIES: RNA 2',3'-cyclic phosphodiesterase [Yersinia]|uniref:RNA 2',3'-cyclic phosphodiesterase n=1 Tax=Yersinia TaxID=629 RepID=UPI0011A57B2F|nr:MULTISPECIES: RNA 2',3'-cyclic phosphodiesterase [Yersinia]MDA5543137.1 RNA 2',3'-cyclic phosphodiesterase [Yersinia rochesterensis]MDN0105903.1 RNA 2',3'-cyclic phosphodiesterase [Yersinia rochesterensis]MDR5016942.1 RNA 2',3'-cyclic phosphodiesterase [Yersinia rochesterensis]UZM75804.1 RNA 2',3'-cyclic phosphodiesterase [Yersinia sp. SCPM-O-B-9106 (C-191)]
MIKTADKTIVNKTSFRRLFFALALPDALQQTIVPWRADNFPPEAGRPIAAANLHLTLAFLGEVSHAKAQVLQEQAGRISQSGFNITLDDIGHWPNSGVIWLGCKNPPRGLLQLAQLLRSQAARSGCYQTPLPFHPHVTLFRGAIRPVAIPAKAPNESFRADFFSLYESVFTRGRTRYNIVQSWPLASTERKPDAI